jgi:hypothetical protein
MANNGASKVRLAELDDAIKLAVERVGAQKIASEGSRSFDWIHIIIGLILRSGT